MFSCQDKVKYEKPEGLLGKQEMIDILYDMHLAVGTSNIQNVHLEKNRNYTSLVYEKYGIEKLKPKTQTLNSVFTQKECLESNNILIYTGYSYYQTPLYELTNCLPRIIKGQQFAMQLYKNKERVKLLQLPNVVYSFVQTLL